jgi:two-component system response regulator NreC
MVDKENTVKIIIADDFPLIRKGLKLILSANPHYKVVAQVEDGQLALEAVEEFRPDIVFMDINMKDMGGIEATRRITKDFPETKVIMLSMHTEKDVAVSAFKAGAKGYVLKDAEHSVMSEAIERVMEGKLYACPHISEKLFNGLVDTVLQGGATDPFETLTPREKAVLRLIAMGEKNKDIAETLFISLHTVKTHRAHIMEKLDIHNTAGLTKLAISKGLVQD